MGSYNRLASTLWISQSTTSATMGLKSNVPKVGSTRRMGPRIGSVIWLITEFILINSGCGRAPASGITKESITLAKMATVNNVMIVLITATALSTVGPA